MKPSVGRKPVLTEEAVRFLRQRRAERLANGRRFGVPDKRLCAQWGITRAALWQAATGITYKWVNP
jgi:hypothetical protein